MTCEPSWILRSHGFLAWCARPALCGIALWGPLSRDVIDALQELFDRSEDAGVTPPCDFVLDARRLTDCAYDVLAVAVASRTEAIQRRVRRQALVHGPGLLGAAVVGFYASIDVEMNARAFDELIEAVHWLAPDDARFAARIDTIIAEAASGSLVVDRLRAWLAVNSDRRSSIAEPARTLGLSPRSLQRELGRVATSFRAVVERARVELAKQLLRDTDLKIAAVASRVGMSSEANFITFFRRVARLSPAAWRARHAR
jgi:AraC-like DNA-binding protein